LKQPKIQNKRNGLKNDEVSCRREMLPYSIQTNFWEEYEGRFLNESEAKLASTTSLFFLSLSLSLSLSLILSINSSKHSHCWLASQANQFAIYIYIHLHLYTSNTLSFFTVTNIKD